MLIFRDTSSQATYSLIARFVARSSFPLLAVLVYKGERTRIYLLLFALLVLVLLNQGLYLRFEVAIGDGYFCADQADIIQFRPPSTVIPHQKPPTGFLDLPDDFQGDFLFFSPLHRGSVLLRLDETAKDYVSWMAQH